MEKTFEASLTELEKIVSQLEDGDLPLEKSLKLFEDGVRLSRECRDKLTMAERRIEILTTDVDGGPLLQDLEPENLRSERKPKNTKRIVFDDDDTPF